MSSLYNNTTAAFEPSVQDVLSILIFGSTSLLGIPGNILVILAVALSRQLQTSTNIFVVFLAITDLLNCLILPVQLMSLFGLRSISFEWVCTVTAVCMLIFEGLSISILTLIAFNRFFLITRTRTEYIRVFTKRNVAVMLLINIGIISTFVVALAVTGLTKFGFHRGICTPDGGKPFDYPSAVWLLLCLIVIVVCYVKIYRHVKRHVRGAASVDQTSKVANNPQNASTDDFPQSTGLGRKAKFKVVGFGQRRQELESTITINILIIIVIFFLSVFPSIIVLFIPGKQQTGGILDAIIAFNSCVNPIVCAWKHPVFRHVFKCILTRKISDIKEPTRWARSFPKTH